MKNQVLFSSKDKSKKLKCHLLQFLFGALRINLCHYHSAGFNLIHLFIYLFNKFHLDL